MLSDIYEKNIRTKEWRDLITSLSDSVIIEPVFDKGNTFLTGLTRFMVKNPSQRNVSLRAEAMAGGDVITKMTPRTIGLRPGMEQVFELEMKADHPLFYGAVKPVKVVFTNSIIRPSGGMFDMKQEYTIYPQTHYYCPLPPNNISINGNLEEWGELPFSSVTSLPEGVLASGEPPLRFAVAADYKYLYIAGHILDDELFFSKNKYNYEQDGMIIHLDARENPERSQNRQIFDVLNSKENQKMIITIAEDSIRVYIETQRRGNNEHIICHFA
jgi:hypothetical protein